MANQYNIRDIASRTGVSERALRYAVDHAMIPLPQLGPPGSAHLGRRRTRLFSPFSAFALAMTAVMHMAGLDRLRSGAAMERLLRWASSGMDLSAGPAVQAFILFKQQGISVELGDAIWIRILVDSSAPKKSQLQLPPSTHWCDILTGTPAGIPAEPIILTRIDVSRLAGRLER